jgi:hypothetical protein
MDGLVLEIMRRLIRKDMFPEYCVFRFLKRPLSKRGFDGRFPGPTAHAEAGRIPRWIILGQWNLFASLNQDPALLPVCASKDALGGLNR